MRLLLVAGDLVGGVRGVLGGVLGVLAGWVEGVFGECRLVVLTGDSVCVGVGDRVDGLVGCGVWGLVRSAQAENPERFVLVDVDGDPSCWGVFLGAVGSGEPQVAIRDGGVFAARLARAVSSKEASDGTPPDAVVDVWCCWWWGCFGWFGVGDWWYWWFGCFGGEAFGC